MWEDYVVMLSLDPICIVSGFASLRKLSKLLSFCCFSCCNGPDVLWCLAVCIVEKENDCEYMSWKTNKLRWHSKTISVTIFLTCIFFVSSFYFYFILFF